MNGVVKITTAMRPTRPSHKIAVQRTRPHLRVPTTAVMRQQRESARPVDPMKARLD